LHRPRTSRNEGTRSYGKHDTVSDAHAPIVYEKDPLKTPVPHPDDWVHFAPVANKIVNRLVVFGILCLFDHTSVAAFLRILLFFWLSWFFNHDHNMISGVDTLRRTGFAQGVIRARRAM